jgi:broad-specificity NMP kinase
MKEKEIMVLYVDADLHNADWTKMVPDVTVDLQKLYKLLKSRGWSDEQIREFPLFKFSTLKE